jgi:outer membrane immunogenic protein
MYKKILFSIVIIGIMTVSSLKAQISVGPGILYGTKIESAGISANAGFDITKKISVLAAYGYFLDKEPYSDGSNSNWWTIDADAAYKFCKMSDKSSLFVLAGVNLIYFKYASSMGNYTGIYNRLTGANIGAGWKLGMGNKMDLVPEVKYTFGDFNYLRFGVKLMFGL